MEWYLVIHIPSTFQMPFPYPVYQQIFLELKAKDKQIPCTKWVEKHENLCINRPRGSQVRKMNKFIIANHKNRKFIIWKQKPSILKKNQSVTNERVRIKQYGKSGSWSVGIPEHSISFILYLSFSSAFEATKSFSSLFKII